MDTKDNTGKTFLKRRLAILAPCFREKFLNGTSFLSCGVTPTILTEELPILLIVGWFVVLQTIRRRYLRFASPLLLSRKQIPPNGTELLDIGRALIVMHTIFSCLFWCRSESSQFT